MLIEPICPRCRGHLLISNAYVSPKYRRVIKAYGCVGCGFTLLIDGLTGEIRAFQKWYSQRTRFAT